MHDHDINGFDGPLYECSTNGSDIGEEDDDDYSIGTSDEEVDDTCNQDIDLNNGDDEFNYQSIANGKFQDTIVVILAQQ